MSECVRDCLYDENPASFIYFIQDLNTAGASHVPSHFSFLFTRVLAQANLDEVQTASNHFVRALMTSVCQSAIICKHGGHRTPCLSHYNPLPQQHTPLSDERSPRVDPFALFIFPQK